MTKLSANPRPSVPQIVRRDKLSNDETNAMFNVFKKYYENISRQAFDEDLSNKTHVILLKDKGTRQIKGFSTLRLFEKRIGKQRTLGIFSGDTILEKEYWGNTALPRAFGHFLLATKIKNPLTPVYWLLISKGYKTYLLMTNNFTQHYPRFEEKTPKNVLGIQKQFYMDLYPDHYDHKSQLIKFEKQGCCLKDGVAEITDDMKAENPKIAFFARKNPNWAQGDELACLAKVSLLTPFQYYIKACKKILGQKKPSKRTSRSPIIPGVKARKI